ncbi:Metallo-dependent phosphatase-like protein [Neurospora tetraspora]|uniref:Metallo-dependent phosphatase-like protein n=1 Tax=Neurospora tetraspora TaxID=94610 RepID=A0AAE0JKJ2_9PEZI|nr:Metallo-dependent phosphatase-like protein [Neurospora tetraspora]
MGFTKTTKTSFLILSDTHGKDHIMPKVSVDVAIHCGDLTDHSKLEEFRSFLELLKSIDAPLKLVIAGNHDFSLDGTAFGKITEEATTRTEGKIEPELMKKEFGDVGQARQLFSDSEDENITFLDEGIHSFRLQNGATLTVYASPYTPSPNNFREVPRLSGFQFKHDDGHNFSISTPDNKRVDIAITHGPPKGVLDRTCSNDRNKRGGCGQLFAAIAKARPRLHCFGHIHEGWGAKLVTWRGKEPTTTTPSHFTEIDNSASILIDSLANYKPRKFESEQDAKDRKKRKERLFRHGFRSTSHCKDDKHPLVAGQQTLFVNAALETIPEDEEGKEHVPWIVELELPSSE